MLKVYFKKVLYSTMSNSKVSIYVDNKISVGGRSFGC